MGEISPGQDGVAGQPQTPKVPELWDMQAWEEATDVGPRPTLKQLRRFFKFNELPGRYDHDVLAYFHRAHDETNEVDRGLGKEVPLLRRYYELVRTHPEYRRHKADMLELVMLTPTYAEQLFDIFARYPKLIPTYRDLHSWLESTPGITHPALREDRITATLDPEEIEDTLAANRSLAKQVVTTWGFARPGEPGHRHDRYEEELLAGWDGQVFLWGGVIVKGDGAPSLWLNIRPQVPGHERPRQSDFNPYQLTIELESGLVMRRDYPEIGFLLFDEHLQHKHINEQALLELLTRGRPQTESDRQATVAAFDEIVTPYLQDQGLFG